MIACTLAGVVLLGLGYNYTNEVQGAKFGTYFLTIGALVFCTGIVGALGTWKRLMPLMAATEISLVVLFIGLYVVVIIALMMASGTTSPVDSAVNQAWDRGLRRDVLENDADRWCEKNTAIVGSCSAFYKESTAASRRRKGYGAATCNMTVSEMALDCNAGETGCQVGSSGCLNCDLECKNALKADMRTLVDPASIVIFILVAIVMVNVCLINVLLGQQVRAANLVKAGYIMNGAVMFVSVLCSIIFTVVVLQMNSECPRDQDCTSWTIMGAFTIVLSLLGCAAVTILGLWRDNMLFLRGGGLAFIIFGFLLLLVAIIMAMAGSVIKDLGSYYNDNWVDIRAELDQSDYCAEVDASHAASLAKDKAACLAVTELDDNTIWSVETKGDKGDKCYEVMKHTDKMINACAYTAATDATASTDATAATCTGLIWVPSDPATDPCKLKIEEETSKSAGTMVGYGMVVIIFMVATIYFNLRAIKQLNKLDDYQEQRMGDITESRAALMKQQAEALAAKKQTVRAHPGRLSALRVSHSKSVLYGVFVWARRALTSQKRRFPARAGEKDQRGNGQAGGEAA
jgi:hypothetical protein